MSEFCRDLIQGLREGFASVPYRAMNSGIETPAWNCTLFIAITHLRFDSGRTFLWMCLRSRDSCLRFGANQVRFNRKR